MDIKFVCLDSIDFENNKVINRQVNVTDAQEYVETLVNKILNTDKKREYERKTASLTMDKIHEIVDLYLSINQAASTIEAQNSNTENNLNYYSNITNLISEKLLQEQLAAEEKYKHLTKIQKGSLVQALIDHNNKIIYLSCLIEHATFIDEDDLKYKIGLPSSDKATLKSCMVYHADNGDVENIFLTDTRTKFTEYWYDGFLDVREKRSDKTNTTEAFKTIRRVINDSLSLSSKSDCTILNNSLNVVFTQGGSFTFSDCLDFLFNDYAPQNPNLDLTDLRNKIEKKAEKSNKFDTVFNIDNSDIKHLLQNTKYTVTDNIELKLKNPKKNLKDYIYSTKLEDNEEKVLIIRNINEDTYSRFLIQDNE
ncbi:hypothetical protein [Clostridium chromiireducens]|uniref:Nucleoid-associated protein n=1 Tax=Clostridium chromiireducens TaxID=225345 RepID=A0A1V4IDW7_9CLOT|nr:hypothetical protein [Clostridium chromiireducens]OPJ58143.1 hypothetical protein CLCHR_40450 [Clostridium chromiireducens]